jgi:Xaa-Pro aminopeptidase
MAFRLEKIDQTHAKRIETKDDIAVIDISQLRQQKKEIEIEIIRKNQEHAAEVARLNQELAKINEILVEFAKIP